MKRYFPLLFLFLALTSLNHAATITVVNQDAGGEGLNDPAPAAPIGGNTGTTVGQQRLIVMQRAAALWGARIVSPVAIQLGAKFDPLTCSESSAVLGSAGPHALFRDFAGAPRSGTYYAVALANAWAGADLDPGNVDLDAQFNSNLGKPGCLSSVQWYYGLDGNAPGGTIDFLNVVLHEFAHGLGFLSTVDLATGAKFNGFNDAFMVHLEDHSTGKLYPNMTDAERLTASTDVGGLHWIGTNVVAASDWLATGRDTGGHVLMYASNPVQPGSSVSHFDTSLAPSELMEPFANPMMDRRMTEELFRDLGWTVLPPIQTNGQVLLSEACVNGVIDPGETVTVELTLTNIGFANAANLTATLLATNGVTNPTAPQNYGAMALLGPSVARSFTFTASGQCGEMINATLHLQDGATDYGIVSFAFRLGTTRDYTNSGSISVPLSGAATPYPSTITISNYAGVVNALSIRLMGMTHATPDDLDILLVGPGGQKALIMSDAGGTPNLNSITLTLSDFAAANLPDASQITNGTYRPTGYDAASDTFSAPAPSGPYASSLSVFNGTNPNGTWQLFIMDDAVLTSGSLAGGWALGLPECCSLTPNQPPTLTFASPATNYIENAAPLGLAGDAGVTDSDSPSLNGGSLTVAFATNGTTADQLGIRNDGSAPGQIGISGNTVTFGGLAIGNCSGGTNGSPLAVNFTSTNATPAAAQALCRAITFFNVSDAPSTNARNVRFTVTDGMNGSATASKTVTILAVNDTPAISAVTDRSINEDTTTGALTFLVGDAETTASALVVSATSSNLALAPLANIAFNGSASNRTVTIQPATNQFGTTLITLFVTDGQATNSTSFLLTVTAINDVPVISSVLNQSIQEDTSTLPIGFTIGDVETAASALTASATSSNLTLVPLANIVFNGAASNRTVTIRPATNQVGTTRVSLFVTDGQATNSTSFLLTVTAINDAPVISAVSDRTVLEDASTGLINFTVGDVETTAGTLTVSATSSNATLAPLANIAFGGSGSTRTLTIQPATNQFGTTLISLFVTDGQATNTTSFLLTVTSVNDSPFVSSVLDRSITEDMSTGPIAFTIGDAETAVSALIVSATSSNLTLVPLSNITVGGSGSSRTVSIQPATNQFGTTLMTLLVSDGEVTNSSSFLVAVTATNDAPEISSVSDQTILEDAGTGAINFTIGDVETAAGVLTVSATSSNAALVPPSSITFGGAHSNRTVMIQPAINESGTTLITLIVNDGQATNTTTFLLTVAAVNDAPVVSSVLDRSTPEDTSTGQINFTIGDAETAVGGLLVSATSSNLALIPVANVVFGGSASNRTVTIFPATNEFGTSLITLFVTDGQATTSTSFLLTVTAMNDNPIISSVLDQSLPEDTSVGPINFTVDDVETAATALLVSATSSNLTLVPLANITLGGSASNRTVAISPATNQFGTALITIFVSDSEVTNSMSFLLTVTPVNDAPFISAVLDQTIPEDASTGPLNVIVDDIETAGGALTLTATSSNAALVPPSSIVFNGSASNRTVTIQPVTNQFGTTLVTLFLTDGQATNSTSFLVTVTAINDAPLISTLLDQSIQEDTGTEVLNFMVSDVETASSALTVSATSSNLTLVPVANIVFSGAASNRTATMVPSTNQSGTSLITFFVTDGQATNSSSFLLSVTPANDGPLISSVLDQTILEDTSTGPIHFTVSDADTPSGALTVTATSSNLDLVPTTNIVVSGLESDRIVTIEPATNKIGTTVITLSVTDGQSTNSTSFLVTVTGVNDSPAISAVPDQTIGEDTSTGLIAFTITDVETVASALAVSAISSNTTLVPLTNIVFAGSDSNRTVTLVPATNEFGTTLITLFVTDGETTNTTSLVLTVTPTNDAPTISSVLNQTIPEDTSTTSIGFSIGDAETAPNSLLLSATSSNATLVPPANISFDGSKSNRSVVIVPAANEVGTTVITFFVTDGQQSNSTSFLLTVTPANDTPTISSIVEQAVLEDTRTAPIQFTVSDPDTAANALTISATSSNIALVPITNIVLGGSDGNRTITIQPATNQFGTTLITLFVDDGQATNTTSFLFNVTSVNDAPTLDPLTNITVVANCGGFIVNFIGVTAGPTNEQQTLTVAAFLSNPALLDDPIVAYQSADPDGSLLLTPLSNMAGTSTISVVVTDTGGAENGGVNRTTNTFDVVVAPLIDVAVSNSARFQGTNLIVIVTLRNSGPQTANGVRLTNVLPAGTTIVSTLSDAASCVSTNGSLVCSFSSLPAHTSAVVTLTLAVEPQVSFTNVSLAGALEIDADSTNNMAVVVIQMSGDQDFDADGIPDGWELANGTDARLMDAAEDPDGDTLTNLQEYLAGTNPHDPTSVLRITGISMEGNSAILSFLAVSNRTYSILSSTNPAVGPWEKVTEVSAAQTGVITSTNSVGADAVRFYRVITPQ